MPEKLMIQRCQQGDEAAWEQLFEQHHEAVARFLFQQSDSFSLEDAEELAQETFLAAVRSIRSFRRGSTLQTWLYRIAMNKGRDLIAKRRAAKRGGGRPPVELDGSVAPEGQPIEPVVTSPGPDELAARGDEFARLRAAMDRLVGPCRDLIELRYFGDLSYRELAAEIGMDAKNVAARLTKCLERLVELTANPR